MTQILLTLRDDWVLGLRENPMYKQGSNLEPTLVDQVLCEI